MIWICQGCNKRPCECTRAQTEEEAEKERQAVRERLERLFDQAGFRVRK